MAGSSSPTQHVTLGRIVRYVLPAGPWAGHVRAAVVAEVLNAELDTVTLNVHSAMLDDFAGGEVVQLVRAVAYDPKKTPGTWHWPQDAPPAPPPNRTVSDWSGETAASKRRRAAWDAQRAKRA